jgi:hypothetical protein
VFPTAERLWRLVVVEDYDDEGEDFYLHQKQERGGRGGGDTQERGRRGGGTTREPCLSSILPDFGFASNKEIEMSNNNKKISDHPHRTFLLPPLIKNRLPFP